MSVMAIVPPNPILLEVSRIVLISGTLPCGISGPPNNLCWLSDLHSCAAQNSQGEEKRLVELAQLVGRQFAHVIRQS
jgi:hypothetical protein